MGKPINVTFKNTQREKELSDYIHSKLYKAGWLKEAAFWYMQHEKNNITFKESEPIEKAQINTEEKLDKNELLDVLNIMKK